MYIHIYIWVSPKIYQNGWFIKENPIKMDNLGVPLFLETSIYASVVVFGAWKHLPAMFGNSVYRNSLGYLQGMFPTIGYPLS